MADNYLERQYEEYQQRKAAADRARKLKWQKQLKAYAKLQASNSRMSDGDGEHHRDGEHHSGQ